MPYYTPSPMVSFQFDPNPSDAQRIVDTTNKIKKQKLEEQTNEMKFKEAEMQFQESSMRMKANEIKMQEAVKAQELDVLAEQTYNGTLAATGDRAEALRSAFAVQAKAGGFAKQRENEQKSMAKIEEIMKQDYLDPQEAQLVADYRTAMSPAGVRITADSVTQEHSRAHAKYDVKTGEYAYRDASGELVVEQKMSEQKAGSIKAEEDRKKKETEDKAKYQEAQIAAAKARTAVSQSNAQLAASVSSANSQRAADVAEKNRLSREKIAATGTKTPAKTVRPMTTREKDVRAAVDVFAKDLKDVQDEYNKLKPAYSEGDLARLKRGITPLNPPKENPDRRAMNKTVRAKKEKLVEALRLLSQQSPDGAESAQIISTLNGLDQSFLEQSLPPEPAPPVTLPTSAAAIPANPLVGNATQAVSLGGLTKFQKFNMQMEGR